MRIGFAGTQKGMSEFQLREVELILIFHERTITEIHHGSCVGADEQFHLICHKFRLVCPTTHPASDVSAHKRATYLTGATVLPAKPALVRNHDIVDSVDIMIATPAQNYEILRSGTWATIRYAKKVGRVIHIIMPDIGE